MAHGDEIVTHRRIFAGLLASFVLTDSACTANSPAEACQRGPLFSSARQRAERAVSELDRTTSLELRDSVSSIVDQILVLREISPRDLRDPLGILLAAYGQLVVAFDAVDWNPDLAAADTNVEQARIAFAETSVSTAAETVESFFSDQCDLAISESNPLFAVSGTTLPLPAEAEEPRLDASEDTAIPASELQALGFLIGETYGVALLAAEAECIARALGSRFSTTTDIDVSDEQFFALVTETFVVCKVSTTPSTAPNN